MEWERAYVVAKRVSWSSCSVVTSGGHEVNTLILLDLDSWLIYPYLRLPGNPSLISYLT